MCFADDAVKWVQKPVQLSESQSQMAASKTLTQRQQTTGLHELITWFGDTSGDARAAHSTDEGVCGVTAEGENFKYLPKTYILPKRDVS